MSTSAPKNENAPPPPLPPPKQPKSSSLESDIALLTQLLSEDLHVNPNPDTDHDLDPENVAELLRRLEAAEGIADGVEERLDGIMDNLDRLLGDLEVKQERGEVVAVAAEGRAQVVEVEVVEEVAVEIEVEVKENGEAASNPSRQADAPK